MQNTSPRIARLAVVAGANAALALACLLGGCDRPAADRSPLPNIPAVVPSAAPPVPMAAQPASATTVAASAPAGDVATTGAIDARAGGGAETSPSKAMGPGNGSTAVGGMAGGQR